MRILSILGAFVLGAMLILVGAGGALWYAKQSLATEATAGAADPPEPAPESVRSGATEIGLETVRQLLSLVEHERRSVILESPENFANFVQQERANQAVLTAAYENAADRNDAVSTLMLRASQKVLAEAYLTQVIRRNIDTNFPSEGQTKAFYDDNKAAFRLPDRVHLWQIFIPAPAQSSATAKKNASALATQISTQLRKANTDFAAAASKHSKHLQSRVNDGYMGLLNMDDLLPEVRSAVDRLKPDTVSAPVQSEAGFHIIKRGALVVGKQLEFTAVQNRIVVQLRREAGNRVRQAAVQKIMETYPVEVDESALESWLQNLQSTDWPTANPPASEPKSSTVGTSVGPG